VQAPLSKKELAALKKEEARRMKAEKKEARKAGKQKPAEAEVAGLPPAEPIGEIYTPFEPGPEAPEIPFQQPLSKKELAALKKEEARRLKAEKKDSKKARPEIVPEPIPLPERPPEAPLFKQPAQPVVLGEPQAVTPSFTMPPPAPPLPETLPLLETPPEPGPKPEPTPFEMPADFGQAPPRLEERLEPVPPKPDEEKGRGGPEISGPPEGFFD
jgi:hypothetical protein